MKNFLKQTLFMSFLLINTIVSAQPGDPDNTIDPPYSLMSNYFIVLVLAGIGIAFWILSKKTEKIG